MKVAVKSMMKDTDVSLQQKELYAPWDSEESSIEVSSKTFKTLKTNFPEAVPQHKNSNVAWNFEAIAM